MAKKIQIDIEVNGKMQKATVSAKKLRTALKEVEQANKGVASSSTDVERRNKGVAGATSNSTKAFSKMTSGLTSGLVPAYAALAANVFAVTAAFNTFRRAAQLEQLETSLIRTGAAAGQNLEAVAEGLKTITNNAIDSEVALRAVAQGTAQGFSPRQLKELTTVARGASVALGRELPDSLDRLIRGTAKLEPEILDELGIIVRLDQATKDYALSINKTSDQLTAFERQQAFANAVTEQGLKKFGDIAKLADTNPFDQLSASFGDLTKTVLEGINVALTPFVEFLSNNTAGLIGALTLIASTIVSQITPALSDMANTSRQKFEALSKNAQAAAAKVQTKYTVALKNLDKLKISPDGFKKVESAIRSSTASANEFKIALKSLRASEVKRKADIKKLKLETESLRGTQKTAHLALIAEKEQELALIQAQTAATIRLRDIEASRTGVLATGSAASKASAAKAGSRIGRREAVATGIIAESGVIGGFKAAGKATKNMTKELGKVKLGLSTVRVGFQIAGAGARLFGAALLNAIPVIGQILFFGPLIYDMLTSIFGNPFETSEIEKATDKIIDSLDGIGKSSLEMEIAMERAATANEKAFIKVKGTAGIIQQGANAFGNLADEAMRLRNTEISEVADEIRDLENALQKSNMISRFFTTGYLNSAEGIAQRIEEEKRKLRELTTSDPEVSAGAVQDVAKSVRSRFEAAGLDRTVQGMRVLDKLIKDIEKRKDPFTATELKKFEEELLDTIKTTQSWVASIENLESAFAEVNKAFEGLGRKATTVYTPLIAAQKSLNNEIGNLISEDGLKIAAESGTNLYETLSTSGDASQKLIQSLDQGQIAKDFKDNLASGKNAIEAMNLAVAKQLGPELERLALIFADADNAARNTAEKVKAQQEALKEVSRFARQNSSFALIEQKERVNILDTQLAGIEAERQALEGKEKQEGVEARLQQLDEQKQKFLTERKIIEQDTLTIAQSKFAEEQRFNRLLEKRISALREEQRIEEEMQKIQDERDLRNASDNPFFAFIDNGKTALDQQISRLEDKIAFEQAQQEAIIAAKQALIKAEYALIDAQLTAEEEKLRAKLKDPTLKLSPEEKTQITAGADRLKGARESIAATESTALENVEAQSALGIESLKNKLEGLKDARENLEDINILQQGIADSLTSNMTSAFDSLIQGTSSAKEAFGQMAKAILADIAKMIAKLLVQKAVMAAMNMIMPGSSAAGAAVPAPTARRGGMFESYSAGGIARGREAGYPAILHGTEAVVPLPNGNSIPVEMKNGSQSINNVTVNVSTDGQTESSSNGEDASNLGQIIAAAVQKELHNQKRAGGILNKHGAA